MWASTSASTALGRRIGESYGRQPYSGNPTVRDDKGGLRKRGLRSGLNGHVPRKRRNCQATTKVARAVFLSQPMQRHASVWVLVEATREKSGPAQHAVV